MLGAERHDALLESKREENISAAERERKGYRNDVGKQ
jgi:hypothetical protein